MTQLDLRTFADTPPASRADECHERVRRSLPLFLRIFVVVLGGILCAQAMNFATILLVRLPQPHTYAIEQIADVLRGERVGDSGLLAEMKKPLSENKQDDRDLQVRSLLAARLGVDQQHVRVFVSRPLSFYPLARPAGEIPGDAAKPLELPKSDSGVRFEIVGSFNAALQQPDGQWRVVTPRGSMMDPWHWRALLWLVSVLLIAVPFAWVISRRVAAPVDLFSEAAARLGRDPNAPPLSAISGPPEVNAAITVFNDLQARLKRYVDDRTTMVAAIAHDLRTPLMRLTLLLENAPREVREPAEAEIKEMSERIRAALAFVRDVATPIRRQRIDLRSLVESVVNDMTDRGHDVVLEACDDATVNADVAALKALLVNLIENALRYASSARLTLRHAGRQAIVEVADDGPGIPESEFENVFRPFYRLESSRNRDTGGMGLGLASARSIARGHGGDITLSNRPEGGLLVRFELPDEAARLN